MRRALGAAVIALLLTAGCGQGEQPDARRSPSTERALPDPVAGRLTRLLGDGTSHEALPTGRHQAASSPVYLPGALAVASGSRLIGLQWSLPTAFALSTDGAVSSLPDPQAEKQTSLGRRIGFRETPLAGLAVGHRYLAVMASGTVESISLDDVSSPAVTPLPGATTLRSASMIDMDGRVIITTPESWYEVVAPDSTQPTVKGSAPPVAGVRAAASSGSGLLLLTGTELVSADGSGQVTARTPWKLPAQLEGLEPTAATEDGAGGLLVTLATPGNLSRARAGAVVRVRADGEVEVLAHGRRPTSGSGCDDASRPVQDAHLGQPVSIVRWGERVVIADRACGSLLQMSAPG